MVTHNATLQPGESEQVTFETVPQEAKVYHVTVNGLAGSFTATAVAGPSYLPIEIVDLDSNDNDIVDQADEAAFLNAFGSVKGNPNYRRQFDADFDGKIGSNDYDIFYGTLGKNLKTIRNNVKTGIIQHLVWPDGWDASIIALNKDRIREFTGGEEGWISVHHHPFIYNVYTCQQFTVDTAVAAYKALGYGCLLPATGKNHAYNIFWTGGDWRDLNNWWILSPQSSQFGACAASPLSAAYQTTDIHFFDYCYEEEEYIEINSHRLMVSYEEKRVDFSPGLSGLMGAGCEEPIPEVFDRTLGR